MNGWESDPNDRDGTSGDNNCGGDASNLSTLEQRQLNEKNPVPATTPTSKDNATKNIYGHEIPRNAITIYSSLEDEKEYKEDLVDVWALQQHLAGNKDPKFLSSSIAERRFMMNKGLWPLDGADQKPESSSWPTAHPGEKLLRSLGAQTLTMRHVWKMGPWSMVRS